MKMTRYLKYSLPLFLAFSLMVSLSKAETPTITETEYHSPDSLNAAIEKQLNIIVSRLLSPNGDGVNDYWHIQGIDKYPDNRVVIYNRWGDKISTIKNYDNSSNRWEGKNKHQSIVPEGTYYYVLEINKEHKSLNGWVYVVNN